MPGDAVVNGSGVVHWWQLRWMGPRDRPHHDKLVSCGRYQELGQRRAVPSQGLHGLHKIRKVDWCPFDRFLGVGRVAGSGEHLHNLQAVVMQMSHAPAKTCLDWAKLLSKFQPGWFCLSSQELSDDVPIPWATPGICFLKNPTPSW